MTATAPDVSVIIPVLDGAETIQRAIESALNQLHTKVEVIVVDDGSSDDGPRLAQAVDSERVRVLTTQSRRSGSGNARNIALDAARGRWIAFLDADDSWDAGRLDQLTATAELLGADLIADDLRITYVRGGSLVHQSSFLASRGITLDAPSTFTHEDVVRYDLGLLKLVVRRSVVEQGHLRFRGRSTEDFAFLFESALCAGIAVLVPEPMYTYVKNLDSTSVSSASSQFWLDSASGSLDVMLRHRSASEAIERMLYKRVRHSLARYSYLKLKELPSQEWRIDLLSTIASNVSGIPPAFSSLRQRLTQRWILR